MQPAPRVSSPQFRLRWRGYDRAEVDEFLRRTAADRQRLHEDLAQIDTIIAGRRGSRTSEPARVVAVEANAGRPVLEAEPAPKPVRATSIGRRYLAMSVISVVALPLFIFASLYVTRGGNPTAADVAGSQDASTSGMTHGSVALPGAAAVDGLLITLTARRPCWVRTAVDGNEPVERLLQQNDTMLVRAKDEAVLRVGDAAALSVLINSQPAKPLGAPGQVVTTRITRTNYPSFLSGN